MTSERGRLGVFSPQRLDDRLVDEFLGLCRGVLMDGEVQEREVVRLEEWCSANRAGYAQWPLDVIATRICRILEDGLVEDEERNDLAALIKQVLGGEPEEAATSTSLPLTTPPPEIVYPTRGFCFTGTFAFGTRKACEAAVASRRGAPCGSVTSSVDYLVIGSLATKAWMHSSYGRKIEQAVELRARGLPIAILSEEYWTRSLQLVPSNDPDAVRLAVDKAIASGSPIEFLYRGSLRVIRPTAFVTWYNQPAVEGVYIAGESDAPDRVTRQYLLAHIARVAPAKA